MTTFDSKSITGGLDIFSPDRNYAVRLYDYCQINPPQSTDLIIVYKFEIVKDQCLGESGIRFEAGNLGYFPDVFPDLEHSSLKDYRSYVNVSAEQRDSPDCDNYLHRFWYWSADSRYFVVFLTSLEFYAPNKVAVFDVVGGRFLDQDIKGVPDQQRLRQVGQEIISRFIPLSDDETNDIQASDSRKRPRLVRIDDVDGAGSDRSRLVRVDDVDYQGRQAPKPTMPKGQKSPRRDFRPPHPPDSSVFNTESKQTQSPPVQKGYVSQPEKTRRLAKLFWGIYIPAMAFVFGLIAYLVTNPMAMAPSTRWKIVAIVSIICTPIAAAIEYAKHRKENDRLVNYLAMGYVVGRHIQDFIDVLGRPKAVGQCYITDQNNRPGRLVTWAGYMYQIVILFDEHDRCVSIKHEVLPDLH